jgi:cystathionine beta-lyase
LLRKRSLLEELLREHLPRVVWRPPDASYLAWLDCTELAAGRHGNDAPAGVRPGDVTTVAGPTRFFLEHAKVALSAGEAFGTGGAGHARLNFATSTEVVTAAVRAMGEAEARAAASHS